MPYFTRISQIYTDKHAFLIENKNVLLTKKSIMIQKAIDFKKIGENLCSLNFLIRLTCPKTISQGEGFFSSCEKTRGILF